MPGVQETVEQVRRIEVDSLLIGDPCGAQTGSTSEAKNVKLARYGLPLFEIEDLHVEIDDNKIGRRPRGER
jgi:hypothetical protein